jgi:hypothetical protein
VASDPVCSMVIDEGEVEVGAEFLGGDIFHGAGRLGVPPSDR